jgi:hypothetical protein
MASYDMHIQEAAGHITSAAAQAERVVMEVMEMLRTGQFQEEVGSPAYVRRLRDQAAVDRYMRDDMCDELAALCEAAAIVRALGYDPPGEVNAQPESSTVLLHCPKCGETFAGYLTTDVIFPHPTESVFRCGNPACRAQWRVEFFEVTEEGGDE